MCFGRGSENSISAARERRIYAKYAREESSAECGRGRRRAPSARADWLQNLTRAKKLAAHDLGSRGGPTHNQSGLPSKYLRAQRENYWGY
jgi:hypothetical protein